MDVQVWNDAGERIFEEPGELVCTQPFPTVPLGFWHDKDNERFLQSYFSQFPGSWCQADFAEESSTIGFRLLGRSDTVLNPGGVRIGTAEIYRQIETIEAVTDSVVIGQPWQDDVRVVLFVVMATGYALTPDMIQTIKHRIRAGATPRHTPSIIVAVDDIPRTISGKIAEKAVLHTVMGKTVCNLDALSNPDALKYFNHRPELEFA
jgi:acetoacetyl-CoA synthetase